MKKLLLSAVFLLPAILLFAQGKSTQQTVDYINSKAKKEYKVSVEKDRELTIEFFNNGELFKTDKLYLATVDPIKTTYSKEEGAIIIRCYAEMPKEFKKTGSQCISREFHTKGKMAAYNRSLIHVDMDQKSIDGLVVAFNHLINICQDEGEYRYIEEFE